MEIYRSKDAAEKNFDDLKNDLDIKRLRIHTQSAMDGRIFIQFIALILTTRLREIMRENNWFQNHNLQEVIEEMKSIREVSIEGKRKKLVTQLTGFQNELSSCVCFSSNLIFFPSNISLENSRVSASAGLNNS